MKTKEIKVMQTNCGYIITGAKNEIEARKHLPDQDYSLVDSYYSKEFGKVFHFIFEDSLK